MSHTPVPDCDHVWTAWTSQERLLQVGELDTIFVMCRTCVSCGLVDEGKDGNTDATRIA